MNPRLRWRLPRLRASSPRPRSLRRRRRRRTCRKTTPRSTSPRSPSPRRSPRRPPRVPRRGPALWRRCAERSARAPTPAPTARGRCSPSPSRRSRPKRAATRRKTHALFTLRDLAQCAPDAFAPHAAVALPRILDALTAGGDTAGGGGGGGVSVSGEVALSAGDALEGVVEALSPGAAMRALCPHVGRAAPLPCDASAGSSAGWSRRR